MRDKGSEFPTPASILKHVEEIDQRHDEAHGRLRRDLRDLETRVDKLESQQAANLAQFAQVMNDLQAIDVGKLRFSPALVVSLIVVILSGAGSVYVFNMGLRAEFRNAQIEMVGYQNLQNQRYGEIRDTLAEMKRLRIEDKAEAQRKLEELQRQALEKTLIREGVRK